MRTELSAFDLHYIVKEFQILINAKIDKIYQDNETFIFQLHLPNKGKKYLKIILPKFIILEDEKNLSLSDKFALSLRKHISNTRIRKIEQLESERIIRFELESKDNKYNLYIELFRPGNIILTKEIIILAYKYKGFGSRLIRPGIEYEYPKKEFNFLKLDESSLNNLLDKSDKSSIVITLATNLGLGGFYAEELCKLANIDKKQSKLNANEKTALLKAIKKLKPAPIEIKEEEKPSKYEQEKTKLKSIIKQQEEMIKGLDKSAKENTRKAELIYEKYSELNKILKTKKGIITIDVK